MNYDDVFKKCIATYGGDAQIDMCVWKSYQSWQRFC